MNLISTRVAIVGTLLAAAAIAAIACYTRLSQPAADGTSAETQEHQPLAKRHLCGICNHFLALAEEKRGARGWKKQKKPRKFVKRWVTVGYSTAGLP